MTATVEAVEAVTASAVVDGLTLLTRWQDDADLIGPGRGRSVGRV